MLPAVLPCVCLLPAPGGRRANPSPAPPRRTAHRQGVNYILRVSTVMVADPTVEQLSVHRGQLMADTAYVFEARHGGGIKVTGQRSVVTTQVRGGQGGGSRQGCDRM